MRENMGLYRGKRKDTGEWVHGSLFVGFGKTYICPEAIAMYYFDGALCLGGFIEVDPETVGQYTGRTDNKGTKVFEGDILRIARRMSGTGSYYFPAIKYPALVAVKWDMCAWMWETICKDTQYYISFPEAWCHFECEVIGNIHDNPELLEVSE